MSDDERRMVKLDPDQLRGDANALREIVQDDWYKPVALDPIAERLEACAQMVDDFIDAVAIMQAASAATRN